MINQLFIKPYQPYFQELFSGKDNITVVSGFWSVKNKYDDNSYDKWFVNTLKINQRYIFFCDPKDNEYILSFRNGYETIFIPYPLSNFYSRKFLKSELYHEVHIPNHELGVIWNEKIHLLKLAKEFDGKNKTSFYIWIDAGIAPYREIEPPQKRLTLKNIESVPHFQLCYSKVDEEFHSFSGGVLLIYANFIEYFHEKYYDELNNCDETDNWKCGIDQVVFSKMKEKFPDLFYVIGEGYGQILIDLFKEYC